MLYLAGCCDRLAVIVAQLVRRQHVDVVGLKGNGDAPILMQMKTFAKECDVLNVDLSCVVQATLM